MAIHPADRSASSGEATAQNPDRFHASVAGGLCVIGCISDNDGLVRSNKRKLSESRMEDIRKWLGALSIIR
jgi:hypothetical protein